MLCQACKQNEATVHITEVKVEVKPAAQDGAGALHTQGDERHLCDQCAQKHGLPHTAAKTVTDVWKLLRSAQPQPTGAVCPDCGMTLRDFRQKGRLGCPKDYEVFGAQLADLLERIHGATRHVGRLPGTDDQALKRMQRMSELQSALDAAIREEAYEAAAKLRDEIRSLHKS